nr:MAG TPA: hypothetical protein [Caudoviricetes sp.]
MCFGTAPMRSRSLLRSLFLKTLHVALQKPEK